MISDYFKISFSSFKSRKLRTGLTLLGVFIGIALLVTLMSLGTGLQKFITDQFEQMGSDKIMIMPGSNLLGSVAEGVDLEKKDIEIIRRTLGVEYAEGMVTKMSPVKYKDETKYTFVIGMSMDRATKDLFNAMSAGWKITKGRELENSDTSKVSVGIDLSEDKKVFSKGVNIGSKLEIEGEAFEVAGIHGRIGNPADDSQLYLPIDIAREIFDEPEKFDVIIAQVSEGADTEAIAETVKRNLRKSRGLEEDEEDFTVQTPEQLLESFSSVLTIIQAVLIGLATISLLVGGVGIANTMYTSILERTREIGVMKSIGAKNSDIAYLFLIESGMIGLGAGIIGVAIGCLISKGIEAAIHASGYMMLNVYLSPSVLVGGLAFAFVFGVVSGLVPALQAAKLRPVDALRYE